MKKWIFAAFTAAAIFATTGVSAQKHITKPEMTPELTTEAEAALQSYKATAEEKEQNKVLKQLYKKKRGAGFAYHRLLFPRQRRA